VSSLLEAMRMLCVILWVVLCTLHAGSNPFVRSSVRTAHIVLSPSQSASLALQWMPARHAICTLTPDTRTVWRACTFANSQIRFSSWTVESRAGQLFAWIWVNFERISWTNFLPHPIYRVAQKSKPPPIFQKIVLKIANEIRFLRKVKVWIKHYNTIRW